MQQNKQSCGSALCSLPEDVVALYEPVKGGLEGSLAHCAFEAHGDLHKAGNTS